MRVLSLFVVPMLMIACVSPASEDDGLAGEPGEQGQAATRALPTSMLVLDGVDAARVQIVAENDQEIVVRVLSMGQPIKDWISASLAMNYTRKSGELRAADFKREVRHIREFEDALLTEIGFPATDGGAKDASFLTLKFAPKYTRNVRKPSGRVDPPSSRNQKMWHPTDFKLAMDGLDGCMTKVSKVDSIEIKPSAARDDAGVARDSFKEPGKIDYPNLTVTFSAGGCSGLRPWIGRGGEKKASLAYLASDRSTLLQLDFVGVASSSNGDTLTLRPARACLAPCTL